MKRKAGLISALVLALGGSAIALGQAGSPVDPGEISAQGSAFGACVADAAQAGAEDPAEACADLRPGPPDADGGAAEGTPAAECQDESKEDGSFGECVAAHASAFGQCVNANAEAGVVNPAEACADLRPGPPAGTPSGPPEGIPFGPPEGTPAGPPEGTPAGPPEGVPAGPPEGTPAGPPEGVPAGPPEGTPAGPPEGVPSGPPEGTPAGPPEGTPAGPPEGVPAGPPSGVPSGRP